MEELFTVGEVAKPCRVHPCSVRRWINDGRMEAIPLPGGSFRIPMSELDRLREPVAVQEKRRQSVAPAIGPASSYWRASRCVLRGYPWSQLPEACTQ